MNPIHKRHFLNFLNANFPNRQERNSGSTGEEIRIFCPFCHGGANKEFSFDINLTKGVTRCWRATCGYNGSLGWFLKDFLNISYSEAMKIMEGDGDVTHADLIASSQFLSQKIEDRYKNVDVLALGETIDVWPDHVSDLDWANGIDDVCEWLEGRGYDPFEFLEQHELFWPSQFGRYEGRVLFKISTLMHRAYLAYAIYPGAEKKTLNPPGSILSRMLYNYNHAYHGETVFICEGIFDAARLISWGLNAVSLFGVNISLDQVYLLSKVKATEVVVLLDEGTHDAAIKVVEALSEYICHKKISFMQIERKGADPDDLTEEEFMDYFEKRKFYLNSERARLRSKVKSLFGKSTI